MPTDVKPRPAHRAALPRFLAALALVLLGATAVHGAGSAARAPGAVDHAASVCGGTAHSWNAYAGRKGDDSGGRPTDRAGHAQWPPEDDRDDDLPAAVPSIVAGALPGPAADRPAGAPATAPASRAADDAPPRAPPAVAG